MLLLKDDLTVTWCEPELAHHLGDLEAGRPLQASGHPLVREIQALVRATRHLKPLVSLAAAEPVKIVVAPIESGYSVSLQPAAGLEAALPDEIRHLLDRAGERICLLSPGGVILHVTAAFAETLFEHCGLEDVPGRSLGECLALLPEPGRGELEALCRRVLAGESLQQSLDLHDARGREWHFTFHGTPLQHGHGAALMLQDRTQDVQASRRLAQTIADFDDERSRQELFVRTLAHDVRSPLATIQMILGRAQQEKIMTGSRFFGLLEENVLHLEDVVNSLLGLIELHQNQFPLVCHVGFALSLELVERQLALQLSESGGRIESDLQVEGLPYVPSWLESVLRNLLVNALKYAHPQRPPRVRVSTRPLPGGLVLLTVADNGRGFPDGKVPETLFEPFKRYHGDVPGSGLGLYLVRSMIERNGGGIAVHTSEDQGTRFELTLVPFEMPATD